MEVVEAAGPTVEEAHPVAPQAEVIQVGILPEVRPAGTVPAGAVRVGTEEAGLARPRMVLVDTDQAGTVPLETDQAAVDQFLTGRLGLTEVRDSSP